MINVVVVLEATLGGTRKYCFDYISRLDGTRFHVTYIYSTERADKQCYEDLKVLRARGIELKEIRMVREVNPLRDIVSFFRLFFFLRGLSYTVIHLHSSKAGFLGRFASKAAHPGAKTIYHPHMMAFRIRKIYKLLEKLAVPLTDVIVADSESEKELVLAEGIGDASKLIVINAGVELDEQPALNKGRKDPDKDDWRKETIVVGAIARLAYPKDPFTFIEMAKILLAKGRGCVFAWVGDGDLLEESRALVMKYGLQDSVKFLGWQSDAKETLSRFDILVHCSEYESFGYVIAEAMSVRKPVVASNVTGVKDLVDDGVTGYLVPFRDPGALADKVDLLIASREVRERFGARGRERVEQLFSLGRMVKGIETLYEKLS